MALWDKITSRGDVEDRRSMAPVAVGGGVSLVGLAVYIVFNLLTGGNLSDVINQLPSVITQVPANPQTQTISDNYQQFAATILGSTNDLWTAKLKELNRTYQPPKLVLFRQATQSGCGVATSDVGPHYCNADQTIYLDETFFDELKNRFGSNTTDVAQAYVIAHEVGHHVQDELGILDRYQSEQDSVKVELEADCFAGIWANAIQNQGILEPGEIKNAMDEAAAVGDDRIQKTVTGRVNPETWTHGSSAERVSWFTTGYNTGSISACNTFK